MSSTEMVRKMMATPLECDELHVSKIELKSIKIQSNSPHEKSRARALGTTIVRIARSLSTNAAQQSTRAEYENDEQNGCDNQAAIIAIDWVLSDIILGSVDVTECIVADEAWRAIDLMC